MSGARPPARDLETFALKKKVLRLETLYDVSRSLAAARDEKALIEEILARAVPVLDAARGFAAAFEDAEGSGTVASLGVEPEPDPLAVSSDPFVLDLARAKTALSRGEETILGRAADLDRLREENRSLKGSLGVDEILVGDSPAMRRAKELVARAAASRVNVLVTGESGTGKELAAKLLHAGSPRREGPFLALNCAAVPESLLESELFGIERGVATGVEARLGKFELASGGTIFLDEIGDTPLAIQAKLLRVLQEREIERLGGRTRVPVDVRVVSATHQDLPAEIRAGRFREDLFYRLRVVEIRMPALR